MLICMREINAYIWLGKSYCVIIFEWFRRKTQNHLIKIISSSIIILDDNNKLIMRVWSIGALNRWGILWSVLEPCRIECLWSQGSSLQLPISITHQCGDIVTRKRWDRNWRTKHSLRTGNELWTLDHILVLGKKERGARREKLQVSHPIQIHGCILGSLQLVDIYDRD